MTAPARSAWRLADVEVSPGTAHVAELFVARLTSGTPLTLPVQVLHGATDGPVMWCSAAVHGDELCGVEIIRRVLERVDVGRLIGTLVVLPVVNVHGFNTGDRYLPDRRDLNRSFPGSPRGSLAARIAHLLITEVVARCDVGVDLHTGSDHRTNLPQLRADLDDPETLRLARRFGAPVALHARTRDGSLRQAATERGATVLLFEGGEANRFDEHPIAVGTEGVLRTMATLGMIERDGEEATVSVDEPLLSRSSRWARVPVSGVLHLDVELGDRVAAGATVARLFDPHGRRLGRVTARDAGVVIGLTQLPLVNRGDAVVHVAEC